MGIIGQIIREEERKLQVDFHGINSFGSRVLFGAVKEHCLEPLRDLQSEFLTFHTQSLKIISFDI